MKEKSQKSKTMQKLNQFTAQILMLLIVFGTLLYSTTSLSQIYFSNPSTSGDPEVPKNCRLKPEGDYSSAQSGQDPVDYLRNTFLRINGDRLDFTERMCFPEFERKCSDCREYTCGENCGPNSPSGIPCPDKCPIARDFPVCGQCQFPGIGAPPTCSDNRAQTCSADGLLSNPSAQGSGDIVFVDEGQNALFLVELLNSDLITKMGMFLSNLETGSNITEQELLDAPGILKKGKIRGEYANYIFEYTPPGVFVVSFAKPIPRDQISSPGQPIDLKKINTNKAHYTLFTLKGVDPNNPNVVTHFFLRGHVEYNWVNTFDPHTGAPVQINPTNPRLVWKPVATFLGSTNISALDVLFDRTTGVVNQKSYEFNDNVLGWTNWTLGWWPGASGMSDFLDPFLPYGSKPLDLKTQAFGAVYAVGDIASIGVGSKLKAGAGVVKGCAALAVASTVLYAGDLGYQIYQNPNDVSFIQTTAGIVLMFTAGSDAVRAFKNIKVNVRNFRFWPEGSDADIGLLAKTINRSVQEIKKFGIYAVDAARYFRVSTRLKLCNLFNPAELRDNLVLWSGRDMTHPKFIKLMDAAWNYAERSGYKTLEITLARFGIVNPLDIKDVMGGNPNGLTSWARLTETLEKIFGIKNFWSQISRSLVRAASGKVRVILGDDLKVGATFIDELEEIVDNKNITELVAVTMEIAADGSKIFHEVPVFTRCAGGNIKVHGPNSLNPVTNATVGGQIGVMRQHLEDLLKKYHAKICNGPRPSGPAPIMFP